MNKLVEQEEFIDSMRVKGAALNFSPLMANAVSLVKRNTANVLYCE